MRTPVPTNEVRNGVRTQAERIQSQRLKTQVRNGLKGELSRGEGSDNNSHFNTVHASNIARTTPMLLIDGRVSRVSDRPADYPREGVGLEPHYSSTDQQLLGQQGKTQRVPIVCS